MDSEPQQPEPCLGRRGYRTDCDPDGRCYSAWACSVFRYCRVRAVKAGASPDAETAEQWRADAKRRAEEEQAGYLEKLDGGVSASDLVAVSGKGGGPSWTEWAKILETIRARGFDVVKK